MPTYDYACKECNHRFEEFQSMTAKPFKKCPSCGRPKLQRLIGTGAGLIFKGSGFYQTDYRSDGYKQAAKADTSTPATPATPAAGSAEKSEKKPETKTDTPSKTAKKATA